MANVRYLIGIRNKSQEKSKKLIVILYSNVTLKPIHLTHQI